MNQARHLASQILSIEILVKKPLLGKAAVDSSNHGHTAAPEQTQRDTNKTKDMNVGRWQVDQIGGAGEREIREWGQEQWECLIYNMKLLKSKLDFFKKCTEFSKIKLKYHASNNLGELVKETCLSSNRSSEWRLQWRKGGCEFGQVS